MSTERFKEDLQVISCNRAARWQLQTFIFLHRLFAGKRKIVILGSVVGFGVFEARDFIWHLLFC